MRSKIKMKTLTGTVCCLFLFSNLLSGQTYNFRNYGTERNIPSSVIYSINQSEDGYLWIGMASGIARFDGFEFFNVAFPDSSSGKYPSASLKDKSGTIWYGCSDGSVYYVRNRNLIKVDLENTQIISDIVEGPEGMIFVIPQGKNLFAVNSSDPKKTFKYSFSINPVMFSGCFNRNGELLIGTQENIMICRLEKDSVRVLDYIEGFDYSSVKAIHDTDNPDNFIVGTDGNGLFKLKFRGNEHSLERFRDNPEWNTLSIQSIMEDRENNLWISTIGSGVIQFVLSPDKENARDIKVFDDITGLNYNNVKVVFQDIEGNYWFGTYGNGLSILTSYAFSYYRPGKSSSDNNILYINILKDKYFLGTPTGFHLFDPVKGISESFTDLSKYVGRSEITAYLLDKDRNLWIGTAGGGLYLRNSSGEVRLFYRSGDSGIDNIRDIKADERNIWLATINGVIIINKSNGEFKKGFDITNGLPHSSINTIIIDNEGNALVGNNEGDRLFQIDRTFNVKSAEGVMAGSTVNRIYSFARGKDGAIWIATRGNGVFKFQHDTVSAIFRTSELLSGYCYSVLADSQNNIWIGHEKGLSKYNPATGVVKAYGADFAKGGVCNPEGMFESADGKVFIGTSDGLIIYDRNKDYQDETPPFTNLNYITINDVKFDYQPVYTLPYKKYIIRLNFVGINFIDPDKVYYSTFVEDFNETWTKLNNLREIPYSLGDGKYKFNIISVNHEGLSQKEPLSFVIIIKKPWWRTWGAMAGWVILLTAVVVLIIKIREKSQKEIQEYLETELEARTSVVIKQKGEIELQNLEITDSINYAKRIQTSILPDYSKLKEAFRDAFVIFQPRDIVSGDFYWFDKLDDDKFILVCADSTGHGVPGAFMSMIGSTLLQDIVTRQRVTKPSQILTLLDKQIFSTLNQNIELGVSNDGMDMVVCEFSLSKRHVRFASAMRPVIIVIGGESFYIKGNRSSVGGESVMEKFFDDQEYYLSEGDTIYLFSDGLPDQFGGADGKKLKIARLKRLIELVSDLPMSEQKEIVTKFYDEWKGTYEQVDDILLIGVKV